MSDKVIIGGVDVSDCENLSIQNGYIGCTDNLVGGCERDNNCIYKQLQRLKAENDALKSQLDFEIMNKETLIYNCEKFQEGNIKLKQVLEEIRDTAIYECRHDCSEIYELCTIESCLEKRIQRLVNEVLEDEQFKSMDK